MWWRFPTLLKNFNLTSLHCNFLKIIGKIDYPESILPKDFFCEKIDFDLLLASNKNTYLLRRSEKSFENTFQKVGKDYFLRLDAIPAERLPRLSINLLGTFFQKEYLKYSVSHKKAGGQKWNGGEVLFKNFYKDYDTVPVGCEVYLHANNIDGATFPYSYPFNSDSRKLVREFEQKVGGGEIVLIPDPDDNTKQVYSVSGIVKVVHDPLILNYWHVEMITKSFNESEIKNAKPKWSPKYFDSIMRNIMKVNAYHKDMGSGAINENVYIN